MVETKTFGSKVFKVVNYIILTILAISCLYPLWYELCVSLSDKLAADGGLVTLWPIGLNFKSYELIMGDDTFWGAFLISVGRVVLGSIWTMVVIIMMAYPLSKTSREYKPRNILMWILVFCMLFSGGTIPWFITVKNYGLLDTFAALIFSGSVPVFNVLLLMNFFRNLPKDLEEAAWVDGCNPLRTFVSIILPSSGPGIVTVTLFSFVWHWNDYYYSAMLYRENQKALVPTMQALAGTLLHVVSDGGSGGEALNARGVLGAAGLLTIIIPMALYIFLQRYFVESIERTGIVG